MARRRDATTPDINMRRPYKRENHGEKQHKPNIFLFLNSKNAKDEREALSSL